ncbi:hypothetical protein Tco_0977426 [Tanacetum coccineum]|uniref:Uncharacterized protein n=1 Tax=Tanacetum coccineum TaxID=301880 RepID=A0ABQ5EKB0_9ASTR
MIFGGDNKLPVIIAKELEVEENPLLVKVLKSPIVLSLGNLSDIQETMEVLWTTSRPLGILFQSPLPVRPHASKCEDTTKLNWEKSHLYGQKRHCPRQ